MDNLPKIPNSKKTNSAQIIVEQNTAAHRRRDGNGTASRVSKQGEERAVVLRYTGVGIVDLPLPASRQPVTKAAYCIPLTAPNSLPQKNILYIAKN